VSVRKKKPSAADVLRQEMQQPLVLPTKEASAPPQPPIQPQPTTPTVANNMTQSNDAASKAAQDNEAKLKQQIEDLQSKLEAKTTAEKKLESELKDAKKMALELSAPSKTAAKSTALAKANTTKINSALTARPTETREETARRRANTDIGWLD
jgi:hypothetical protein